MRFLVLFIVFMAGVKCSSQTLAGNAVFNFLNQSNTAQLSGLGGINVSNISNDIGLAFHNPALLRNNHHQQFSASFNSFLAGIKNYGLTAGYHIEKYKTNIAFGVNYFNYGSLTQTDAAGNILGSFKPTDYVVQLSASKLYKENWWYGATFKFINSSYSQYRSSGIAFDVGVAYYDSSKQLQAGVVVKNMGTQLKTYAGEREELPFDLQAGITKRLAKAPLQFSLTAHHLHRFNISYNDTSFRRDEGEENLNKGSFANKLLSHLVLSAQVFIGNRVELTSGYNFLRRNDLNVFNASNGLNGFTLGFGITAKKFHVRYGTGFYQRNLFHQFSLNMNWKGTNL